VHPTQAYEAALLGGLGVYLYFLAKKRKLRDGGVSLIYLMGYAAIRFFVEYFRGDSIRGFIVEPWISTSQGIAIIVFFASAAILVGGFRRNN
jgi:phosphatidylglycerol:prolipoprotein diacylglycerol transferase